MKLPQLGVTSSSELDTELCCLGSIQRQSGARDNCRCYLPGAQQHALLHVYMEGCEPVAEPVVGENLERRCP